MRRGAIVFIGALGLVAWFATAADVVFHDGFESGDTTGWWAPARVGRTGQTGCFDQAGDPVSCAGTGQDGDLRSGVPWPGPRFVDNGDGTVTDMLTGLVWLEDASCSALSGTDVDGKGDWGEALSAVAILASGTCGLGDGSSAGDWRLPTAFELQSLVDLQYDNPALSDAAGTAQWTEGNVFSGVQSAPYWSSTTFIKTPWNAWAVDFSLGRTLDISKDIRHRVWPVRAQQ